MLSGSNRQDNALNDINSTVKIGFSKNVYVWMYENWRDNHFTNVR